MPEQAESTDAAKRMLYVMNATHYRMYEGTVPAKVKARRRAAGKVAKRSRKLNRG